MSLASSSRGIRRRWLIFYLTGMDLDSNSNIPVFCESCMWLQPRIFCDVREVFGSSRQFWRPGSSAYGCHCWIPTTTFDMEGNDPTMRILYFGRRRVALTYDSCYSSPFLFPRWNLAALDLKQSLRVPGKDWRAICEGLVKLPFLRDTLSEHRMLDIYGLSIERADRGRHVLAIRCCIVSQVGKFNPAAAFWKLSVRFIYHLEVYPLWT